MPKRYRSKIAPAIAISLVLVFAGVEAMMLVYRIWPAALLVLAMVVAVIWLYFGTVYEICENKTLKVKSGFLGATVVPVDRITEIRPSRSSLAAPAWSANRLEIVYRPGTSLLVSPVRQELFIHDLLLLRPEIVVKL